MGREGVENAKNDQEKYVTDTFSNCQEPAQFVNSKSDRMVFYSFFLFLYRASYLLNSVVLTLRCTLIHQNLETPSNLFTCIFPCRFDHWPFNAELIKTGQTGKR